MMLRYCVLTTVLAIFDINQVFVNDNSTTSNIEKTRFIRNSFLFYIYYCYFPIRYQPVRHTELHHWSWWYKYPRRHSGWSVLSSTVLTVYCIYAGDSVRIYINLYGGRKMVCSFTTSQVSTLPPDQLIVKLPNSFPGRCRKVERFKHWRFRRLDKCQ